MRRVLLDSNVFVSALLFPSGTPGEIYSMFKKGEIDVIVSEETAEELKRVLKYKKLSKRHGLNPKEIDELVEELKNYCVMVKPGKITLKKLPSDPGDIMVIAAAVAGQADYIVSGDMHLLELGDIDGIEIVTPREFVGIIHAEPKG